MPQRAKTPPPPQEEIFMTVHYPYPQHANMEMGEDVERVARWLGSIVKPAYLNAFYHKPSARNTVIIEVSKAIGDDERKLLGQHIWNDILINPSEGEKGHRSAIFYCVYKNIRDVQKHGWRRIDFEDTWFMPRDGRQYTSIHYDQIEWEDIVKEDGVFCIPYPLSTRCDVPMEDPTNRGFCRPLPVSFFPIPVLPEMPREVPGTLKWARVKAAPESAWAKMPSKAIKEKPESQKATQQKDQRGRTAVPRNRNVGPPVAPVDSGVNHKFPGSLPPGLVINDKGKGKQKETGEPSISVDELVAHTVAMELEEDEEYQEYYGAGVENIFPTAKNATSPTFPPLDRDPIDHTGVGVHVSGVVVKTVVVEDSLWGDPLENLNKKKKKDGDPPLCDYHGRICSKGICKVYEKQLREFQKKKDLQESRNSRNGDGGQNNERGGTRGRFATRPRMLIRGGPLPGRDSGPRPPTDENRAPRRPNGVTPPRNTRSKPNDNPKVNDARRTTNNARSPGEMGESAKPADKPDSDSGAQNDGGEKDGPRDPPAERDWSQSEIGGGSQGDLWSGPGKAGGKPDSTKNGPGGTNKPTLVKPGWGSAGGVKDWTTSELGSAVEARDRTPGEPGSSGGTKGWTANKLGGAGRAKGWATSEPDSTEGAKDWTPSELGSVAEVRDWTPSELGSAAEARDRTPNELGRSGGTKGWTANKLGGAGRAKGWATSELGSTGGAKDWTPSELGSVAEAKDWTPNELDSSGGTKGWTANKLGGAGRAKGWGPSELGSTGGAKGWTTSELGAEDSVSQIGDDVFRTAPKRNPEKKSWADEVEDEMMYANGGGPAPITAPNPEGGDGDGDGDEWVNGGKRKRKGKGKGKAKSTTGWSGITNEGPW